jgi:hypothetical protein
VLWIAAVSTVAASLVNLEIAAFTAYGSYRYLFIFIPIVVLIGALFLVGGDMLTRYAASYAAGALALALLLLVMMRRMITGAVTEHRA